MTRREKEHGEVSMKEIDERYIATLDEFGFGMFRTKAGVNIYHTTSTGTFMINLNGEDFVDMLVSYAETFDPEYLGVLDSKKSFVNAGYFGTAQERPGNPDASFAACH